MASVVLQNVTKQFGSKVVLEGLNLEVRSGETVGLVGANGTGKTTIFKLMAGLIEPDMGTVTRSRGLTVGYLQRFFYGIGQTEALMNPESHPAPRGFLPRANMWTKAMLNGAKYRIGRPLVQPDTWIKYLTRSSYYRGRLAAAAQGLPELHSKAA